MPPTADGCGPRRPDRDDHVVPGPASPGEGTATGGKAAGCPGLRRSRAHADGELAAGHSASARSACLRASTYYDMCLHFILGITARAQEADAFAAVQRCRQASQLFDPPFEPVRIPNGRSLLAGCLLRPGTRLARRPTDEVLLDPGRRQAHHAHARHRRPGRPARHSCLRAGNRGLQAAAQPQAVPLLHRRGRPGPLRPLPPDPQPSRLRLGWTASCDAACRRR